MQLHNVLELHDTQGPIFCGPFAMSAVTGKKMSEVYAALKALDYENSPQATHTDASQLLYGMYDLGYAECLRMGASQLGNAIAKQELSFDSLSLEERINWVGGKGKPNGRTLSDLPSLLADNLSDCFIIGVPGHWIAYSKDDNTICCNINREIVSLEEYIDRHGDQPVERITGYMKRDGF